MNQKMCSGSCSQGRKPCPTPIACESPDEEYPYAIWDAFVPVAIFSISCCVYIIWMML